MNYRLPELCGSELCGADLKEYDAISNRLGIISDYRLVSKIIKNPFAAIFSQTEET